MYCLHKHVRVYVCVWVCKYFLKKIVGIPLKISRVVIEFINYLDSATKISSRMIENEKCCAQLLSSQTEGVTCRDKQHYDCNSIYFIVFFFFSIRSVCILSIRFCLIICGFLCAWRKVQLDAFCSTLMNIPKIYTNSMKCEEILLYRDVRMNI